MRACLHKHMVAHRPDLVQSRLLNEFDKYGWQVIFTPPYTPQFQPIEMVWGHCKGHVARQYVSSRTFEETAPGPAG